MPREKTDDKIQINIRIPKALDKRLREAAARMPISTRPAALVIRGIELAIKEVSRRA